MTRRQEPDYPDDDPKPPDEAPAGGEGQLRRYLRGLYRRRWIAATTFVTVVTIGAVQTFTTIPVYEATAQLLIETGERNVLTFKDVVEQDRRSDDYAQTQHRLLRSRALAKQTLDALKLWDRPPFGGTPAAPPVSLTGLVTGVVKIPVRWVSSLSAQETAEPSVGPPEPARADETAAQSAAIDRLLAGVSVAPIRASQLVDVKYRSSDPRLAAMLANGLAQQYIVQTQNQRLEASREASSWLEEQLEEQRKRLQQSEQALQRYREQHDAVSLEGSQNIVVQKLADLNAAVTKAKLERIQREADFRQLQSLTTSREALDTFPAILANSYIQQLKAELSQLQAQRTQLGERYLEKHPNIVKVTAAIESAKAKLDMEIDKVVQSVQNEFLAAQSEEESLTAALDAQKNAALAQNRKGIDYAALQRDVTTNRQVFEGLLQRVTEAGISGELKASNVRIIDEAEVPRTPVLPQHRRSLLFAMLFGSVLAVGLAIFIERLDNRIRTPDEIAAHLRIPCLGLVPMVPPKAHGAGAPLINNGVPPRFAEAFRGVRTNVLFSSTSEGARSLVVTSTGPGEGKTVVALNLAMAVAQTGQRVMLVDADMRRPSAHAILNLSQEPGLSNLIVGNAKASEAIRPTAIPGLWVLSCGRIPPNPAELLGSARFADFLGTLREHFDWVILDSPPVMAVTDATVLSHLVTDVIFVVGAEMVSRTTARTAVKQLETAEGKLMGAVLNRVNLDHTYYYSKYYRREYDSYHVAAPSETGAQ